ncbi:Two-component system response regulator [Labilithrix luteola]|uniref:Two-component system response regulator n=1 Tax=Labilithrix luteola TaxID=1391654 RepID=A0A0K1PM05_9BACT|nr:response regulator [Labilithrix luteola]AKU94426.1 Two-component system response regulator [Labilithrix luteola]
MIGDLLLVEDNPGDVVLIKKAIERVNFARTLHVAGDGEAALRFFRREAEYAGARRPDLVLMDLNLPRKDGRQVLAEVKSDPVLRSIPVVVLTSSDAPADVRRAYDLHANSVVTKPLNLRALQSLLSDLLGYWCDVVKLPPQ